MHFTTQYHMYLHWCPAPCCWAVCHVEQCTHTHTHFSWWTVLVAFSFDAINPRQTLCRGPNDLILINYVALVWTIRSIKKVGSFRKHRKVVAFRFWEVIKGASRRLFPLALSSLIRTRLIDSDSGLRLEHDLSLKVRTAVSVIVCHLTLACASWRIALWLGFVFVCGCASVRAGVSGIGWLPLLWSLSKRPEGTDNSHSSIILPPLCLLLVLPFSLFYQTKYNN